jgi:hypothetical protein
VEDLAPALSHSVSAPASSPSNAIPLQVQRQRLAWPLSAAYGLQPRDRYAELKAAQTRMMDIEAQAKLQGRSKSQVQVVVFSVVSLRGNEAFSEHR